MTGIIQDELKEKLENQEYNVDKAPKLAKEITDSIKKKLKGRARCPLPAARCPPAAAIAARDVSHVYSRC